MAECIILKGGGGTDLDVITAGAGDVVAGKVIVDKEGDPITGTLAEMNDVTFGGIGDDAYVTSPIVGTGQNANVGAFDYNLNGYKKGKLRVHIPNAISPNIKAGVKIGGPNGYVEGSFTSDATVGGPAHILAGKTAYVNGFKVTGNIPSQYAEIAGDRVWATVMSNWAGTINLGVRNGHYLNGVNWIQQDIPNYQAGNIKKGVNIGGLVGTWEGYVPGAQDLYYYGNNISGFTSRSGIVFQAGQLLVPGGVQIGLKSGVWVNLVGKSQLLVQGVAFATRYNVELRLSVSGIQSSWVGNTVANNGFIASIPLSALQTSEFLDMRFMDMNCTVSRIWLT